MEKLTLKEIAGYLPYGLKVSKIHTLHAEQGIGNINQVVSAVKVSDTKSLIIILINYNT